MKSTFAGSGGPPFLAALRRTEKALWRKFGANGKYLEVGRILSVDPGKITGVAVYWFWRKSGKVIAWAETLLAHDEKEQTRAVLEFLRAISDGGRADVVVEDFIVHSVKKEKSFLSPVRIGRAIEFAILERQYGTDGVQPWFYPVEVFMVPPSEMSGMDDARLKHLGFFTPGPDHRRDASRHALLHLRRIRSEHYIKVDDVKVSLEYWKSENKTFPPLKVLSNPAAAPRMRVSIGAGGGAKIVR